MSTVDAILQFESSTRIVVNRQNVKDCLIAVVLRRQLLANGGKDGIICGADRNQIISQKQLLVFTFLQVKVTKDVRYIFQDDVEAAKNVDSVAVVAAIALVVR